MKKDLLLSKLRQLKPELIEEFHFTKMALFGSYAREEQQENSDIDLLIWSENKNYFSLINLRKTIEAEFHCNVDLGYFTSMKGYIKSNIESEMIYV